MDSETKKSKISQESWDDEGSKPIHTRGSMDQIERLVEENLLLTKEIHKMTKKISIFVRWSRVFSILKILLIVVPIILGILYLPPLLKDVFDQYKDLFGVGGDANSIIQDVNNGGINLDDISSDDIKKFLNR